MGNVGTYESWRGDYLFDATTDLMHHRETALFSSRIIQLLKSSSFSSFFQTIEYFSPLLLFLGGKRSYSTAQSGEINHEHAVWKW
jgi:hypothetical protein